MLIEQARGVGINADAYIFKPDWAKRASFYREDYAARHNAHAKSDSNVTRRPYTQLQKLALAALWFAISISGIVWFEPAPFDAVMMGLIWLLPLVGLCTLKRSLAALLVALLILCAAGFVTSSLSARLHDSIVHNIITLYLSLFAVTIAAFICQRPEAHLRLIFSAYTVAAVFAASAGIIGYFQLLPGTTDLFTKFGRAAGTFKDPNVLGPFLIPVVLYTFHQWMNRKFFSGILPAAITLLLTFTILISFSRGAWVHLIISLVLFTYFSFVTVKTNRQRLKLLFLAVMGGIVAITIIAAALQTKSVAELFEHRAAVVQKYDVGPNGRFGGQEKALSVILDHPMGIGVGVFGTVFHHEQPHNNYLTTFLRSGWIGGFIYLFVVIFTLGLGFRHILKDTATRPLFIIVYSSFVGLCLEGLLIDTDHWRHFFLLLGMTWGLLAADNASSQPANSQAHAQGDDLVA